MYLSNTGGDLPAPPGAQKTQYDVTLLLCVCVSPTQVVIYLPIQALRIAMQWKSSALASLSLDYLQAALTLGEFMFTFSLVAFNYMDLQLFSEVRIQY